LARSYDVSVLHDFFVDRLVEARPLRGLTRQVLAKAADGGGGLHSIAQTEVRGGNAVNLAHALGRLGLKTLLVTHSEPAHEALLRSSFNGLDVDLRVKRLPAGLTVAFEGEVNVMLGDARGAADFGPSLLDGEDWKGLGRSRVVCSVNWAANRRGTELVLALRQKLGKEKTLFLDPADFRDRRAEFTAFLRRVAKKGVLDWVSMNEEEAKAAAGLLGLRRGSLQETCRTLARELGVVFDLHGANESYASEGLSVASARAKRTNPRRLTGAGDVWDAGAIYGRLKGYDEERRLEFANAAAKAYLESAEPVPPTVAEVLRAA
jgi:ribokinase